LPEARGQGVAGALIGEVLHWCRMQGRACVQVTITPEGEAAHGLSRFYNKIGFVDSGRRVMSKTL
jgi:GNAT superfamily N-acetyltransferase